MLLINDSVFGPFGDYDQTFQRVFDSQADFVGLTESIERSRHFQSYFIGFNKPSKHRESIEKFWNSVENLPTKKEVIEKYELRLLEHCIASGLTAEAIFSATESRFAPASNPTHAGWSDLAKRGFPYLKVELLKLNPSQVPLLVDWRHLVADQSVVKAIEDYIFREK